LVTTILPDLDIQLNPPGLEGIDRSSQIVIRIGLNGLRSVEIIADDSEMETRLRQLLAVLGPTLDSVTQTANHEAVGASF
jgi:hypothetical protein